MPQIDTLPQRILAALEGGPKTRRELATQLEARYDQISTATLRLARRGQIIRCGDSWPKSWQLAEES